MFAEKLRALFDRIMPRDLYDVIHFYLYKKDQLKVYENTLLR
ncbi:MAG: nucleotidyl transferase AbiEii/AbiGii toxin family protein [Gammaproteobacteria bacterium]|nr:nucleotidyl transferase AbiEii/AbiGii toxin family protein [Gammaproteobacteria bacterium]